MSLVLVAFLLVSVALAVVGRWEGERAIRRELREMRRAVDIVGPTLALRKPSAYRSTEEFACLIYRTSKDEPHGLELCFDAEGRLVETIDRRGSGMHVGSLREQPEASTTRTGVKTVLRVLRAAAPKQFPPSVDKLPIGGRDVGPIPIEGASSSTRG